MLAVEILCQRAEAFIRYDIQGTGKHRMISSRADQFGKLIRERRRLLNLTQEELAGRIRVSMPFVGHLETGHRCPSEKTIAKLAKVLGMDQRELFLLANPRTRNLLRSLPHDSTQQLGISLTIEGSA